MAKYEGCWYCDNLIDCPDKVALLYLGFPRCMIVIPSARDLWFNTFDGFLKKASVNWLDPNDKGTEKEREGVLAKLWNFSVSQEHLEDELYGD